MAAPLGRDISGARLAVHDGLGPERHEGAQAAVFLDIAQDDFGTFAVRFHIGLAR
jgi:hypothetical protein